MKINNETLQFIKLFEKIAQVKVKDCFQNNERLLFIIEGNILKAIGKNGSNIKKFENMTKRKIKVVEFSKDIIRFIRSFLFPIQVDEIKNEEGNITIKVGNTRDKGLIIGRDRRNIENLKKIAGKFYSVIDIKIV